MRRVVVAGILAALLIAGCATPDGRDAAGPQPTQPALNMWGAGLADYYETPDIALTRSSDERRADVAPPGDPAYARFDQVMLSIMERYDVPAGSLALMHDGRLLYASGYGYTKPDGTGATDTDKMFRMASVTKPIARALVSLQVEQGLYEWDDPVFCVPPEPDPDCRLPLTPHPYWPVVDERVADITVRMLVDHTAGWDRSMRPDKLEIIQEMQDLFDIQGMPGLWHAGLYLMGTHLANDPGRTFSYCSVCYMLVGLVAEAATGVDLQALYDAYLFRPLEVEGDIELGKMPLADRNPREPFYISGVEVENVYDPDETVDAADGEYHFDITSSAGALIGTPEAVAAVYEAYPVGLADLHLLGPLPLGIDPYDGMYDAHLAAGGQYGTNSLSVWAEDIQTNTGIIQYVVLFNADYIRPNSGGCLGSAVGVDCVGWRELQNELFLMLAEKAREG